MLRSESFETHCFSNAVRQDGQFLNVIRVAYLSRDVVLQNILEETHLYEFDC